MLNGQNADRPFVLFNLTLCVHTCVRVWGEGQAYSQNIMEGCKCVDIQTLEELISRKLVTWYVIDTF